MKKEVREIHTPLELQAFLNCSDESLKEICKLMVELAETEKPWTIPFVSPEEEIDELLMKTNSFDLSKEWLSKPQWKPLCPQLKRLQQALAEFDAYIIVKHLSQEELEAYNYGAADFGEVALLKYAYPHSKRLGSAYFYSEDPGGSPSVFAYLSLSCHEEPLSDSEYFSSENPVITKLRQYAQEGRYDDMEDPATIPPFEYNKDLSLRDLYDDDELDED